MRKTLDFAAAEIRTLTAFRASQWLNGLAAGATEDFAEDEGGAEAVG